MSFLASALESVGSALGAGAGNVLEEKAHELEKAVEEKAIALLQKELEELEEEVWAIVPPLIRALVCFEGPRAIDKIRALSRMWACVLPTEVNEALPELFDKQDNLDEYTRKLADLMEKMAEAAVVTAVC
tara:strand:- start:60 stop:449 length:390 start_codon:yes stop_codon:yes gene_type:complete